VPWRDKPNTKDNGCPVRCNGTGRYQFNGNGWRSEDRHDENDCVMLDFSSHAAYYVVYCDVADGMLRGVHYREAAQIVFVE
jgi:hypothetical protein